MPEPAAFAVAEPGALADWGPVAEPIGEPVSHTRGRLLAGGGGRLPEAGLWQCTPGVWRCRVTRDEFCHFLAGRAVYTHDDGARRELRGGEAAFFPAGWSGRCEVLETVTKLYMIA